MFVEPSSRSRLALGPGSSAKAPRRSRPSQVTLDCALTGPLVHLSGSAPGESTSTASRIGCKNQCSSPTRLLGQSELAATKPVAGGAAQVAVTTEEPPSSEVTGVRSPLWLTRLPQGVCSGGSDGGDHTRSTLHSLLGLERSRSREWRPEPRHNSAGSIHDRGDRLLQ